MNILKKIYHKFFPFNDIKIELEKIKKELKNNQAFQRSIFFHYQFLKLQNLPLPEFNDTGFRIFSQNDEDGLLLFIFSQIGFTNKVCIDMAFGSPYNANVTNLICNWGFTGLLVEGSNLELSRQFFNSHPDTFIYPPVLVESWITAENVNQLCSENGFSGEIDLFSLDIDGMDYWIWKTLDTVKPRVFVCEFANFINHDKSITVPYKADFNRFDLHPDFMGASLSAFVKLSKEKGYRLIGCNKYNFNAFFLRNDIGQNIFPEVAAKDCLLHPQAIGGQRLRFPLVKDFPWMEV